MARELTGKVVVITGASSDLGKGFALTLAEHGASLMLAARRVEVLAELAEECIAVGGRALPMPTDVTEGLEVERLARAALREFGRIDVWINNAGVRALHGSYYAYRQFLAQRSGILINVCPEPGRSTAASCSSYAASIAGVVGLGDSLRREIAQAGMDDDIHVCTVVPAARDPSAVVDTIARLVRDPRSGKGVRTLLQEKGPDPFFS